jgi:hypothetical protein
MRFLAALFAVLCLGLTAEAQQRKNFYNPLDQHHHAAPPVVNNYYVRPNVFVNPTVVRPYYNPYAFPSYNYGFYNNYNYGFYSNPYSVFPYNQFYNYQYQYRFGFWGW